MDKKLAKEVANHVAVKARNIGFPVAVAVVDALRVCRAVEGTEHVESEDIQNAIEIAISALDPEAADAPFYRRIPGNRPDGRMTIGIIAISGESAEKSYGFLDEAVETYHRRAARHAVAV